MSKEKSFDKIMEIVNGLSEFKQLAFQWALCHYKLMELLCTEKAPLSIEEFEKELKKAINTNDYVYYVLLIYLNVVSKDTTSKNQKLDEPKSS